VITEIELNRDQSAPQPGGEKIGELVDVEVSDPDFGNVLILKEIKGAGRTLQARAEYEHAHWCTETGGEADGVAEI
jgi:hypothetical protein